MAAAPSCWVFLARRSGARPKVWLRSALPFSATKAWNSFLSKSAASNNVRQLIAVRGLWRILAAGRVLFCWGSHLDYAPGSMASGKTGV